MAINALVRGPNLGPEFGVGTVTPNQIRVRLGQGLDYAVDGSIEADLTVNSTAFPIQRSELAAATINVGQDANSANLNLAVTSVRADGDWTVTANSIEYAGSPDRVQLFAIVEQDDDGAAVARANPSLRIQKNNGGGAFADWSPESSTGYIRDATGHVDSSNTIAIMDPAPGVDPGYRLVTAQGSGAGQVTPVVDGILQGEALITDTIIAVTSVVAN